MQNCNCGTRLTLDVRESEQGYYLASSCGQCGPHEWYRESSDYASLDEALDELMAVA